MDNPEIPGDLAEDPQKDPLPTPTSQQTSKPNPGTPKGALPKSTGVKGSHGLSIWYETDVPYDTKSQDQLLCHQSTY